jgi:hypothetical protein
MLQPTSILADSGIPDFALTVRAGESFTPDFAAPFAAEDAFLGGVAAHALPSSPPGDEPGRYRRVLKIKQKSVLKYTDKPR